MEKLLKIGIDIDNTLVSCKSFLYNLTSTFKFSSIKNKLKYVEIDKNEKIKKSKAYLFLKKVFKFFNPDQYEIFPEAIETINYFKDQGYEVQLITSRPKSPAFIYSLREVLQKYNVKYDKLIAGCNNKPQYVKEKGIDILVDDLPSICKEVEYIGKKSILFQGTIKDDKKLKRFEGISTITTTWSAVRTRVEELADTASDLFNKSNKEETVTKTISLEWSNELPKDFANPFKIIEELE